MTDKDRSPSDIVEVVDARLSVATRPDPGRAAGQRAASVRPGSGTRPPAAVALRSRLDALAERVVLEALDALAVRRLEITLPDGVARACGPTSGEPLRMRVHHPGFFARLLWRPQIAIGESYVDGQWDTDDLPGVLGLLMLSVERARHREPFATLNALGRHRPRLPSRQSLGQARRNIHYHYDLGNEFFRLFLDESMTYSCAYFTRPDEPLELAQRNKYERICEKLQLSSADHVLEIGCGWGGFALHAAREHGARVTGLTISREQLALARRRVAEAGLDGRIEIRFEDYRQTTGRFSKIASIEMLEAIGHAQLPTFFASCDRLLEPEGLACIQTIAMPDQRYERYRRRTDWIREHIFPGANLPSLTAIAAATTRSSSLMLHAVEDIGIHYAATLRAWRERFFANIEPIRELGYGPRFERIWDFYLASCEAGFEIRALRDLQLVFTRPLNTSLPRYAHDRAAGATAR